MPPARFNNLPISAPKAISARLDPHVAEALERPNGVIVQLLIRYALSIHRRVRSMPKRAIVSRIDNSGPSIGLM
jgi:hypothetical protein